MKRTSIFALLCFAASAAIQSNAAEIVVGPGVQQVINAYTTDRYHLVSGTKITSPSVSGPPTTQFQIPEAINFDGGGSVQIDGGEYHGGNASFGGPPATFTSVNAGVAIRLNSFSADIYGGTFLGGDAFSTATSGAAAGGSALVTTFSDVKIHGGSFSGGNLVQPNVPYNPSNYPVSAPDIVLRASTAHLYGGHVSYVALLNGSILNVYGTNFVQFGNMALHGKFADGTPINLLIFNGGQGSQLVLHNLVPEPLLATLLVAGAVLMSLPRRMISKRHPHCS